MKTFNNYISEKLVINKNTKLHYRFFPTSKIQLIDIIKQRMKEEGNECDLNDIDVSEITDMTYLFFNNTLRNFTGNISQWDVSNVKSMEKMFAYSEFNGDISDWNVGNVKDMNAMFMWSKFNNDISKWNISNVEDMGEMFAHSHFNQDISNWNVNKVESMIHIFAYSPLEDKQKEWWNRKY